MELWLLALVLGIGYFIYYELSKNFMEIDFDTKSFFSVTPVEKHEVVKPPLVVKKEKATWELMISNSNHPDQLPQLILRTSSFELANHLMYTMHESFSNLGYKSFSLYIKSNAGGIVMRK